MCPECKADSEVSETRERPYGIRRRRKCKACGHRWSTVEIPVEELDKVSNASLDAEEVRDALTRLADPIGKRLPKAVRAWRREGYRFKRSQ